MSYLRNNPQAMQAIQQGMAQGGPGGFGVPGLGQVQQQPGGGGQGYGPDMISMPMPGGAGATPGGPSIGGGRMPSGGGFMGGDKPMPLGGGQDPRFTNKPMSFSASMMPGVEALPAAGPQLGEKPMPTDPRFDPSVVASNKPMPPGGPSASERVRQNAQAAVASRQGMQQDPAYQRQQNALAQAAGKPLPFGQGNPGAAQALAKPGWNMNPVEGPPAVKPPSAETPANPQDPVYTKPKPGSVGGGGAVGGRRPIRK